MSALTAEAWASGIISALEPSARMALAKAIAGYLRPSQSKRIGEQKNPDGSPFEPRKPQLRRKRGKIRRAMFAKLRTAKFIKAQSTPDAAIVRFTSDVERIARVHQLGLRDLVNRRTGKQADYPARRLLGMTADDEAKIKELTLAHLDSRL